MAFTGSLQISPVMGFCTNRTQRRLCNLPKWQDSWSSQLSGTINKPIRICPYGCNAFKCNSFFGLGQNVTIPSIVSATGALSRSIKATQGSSFIFKTVPAVGIILFAIWGLGPLMRISRNLFLHKNGDSWKKSTTHYVLTCYLQPILLWTGVTLICRGLDPLVMPSEASQLVKQRLSTFVKSLSTVLAFAYCLSGAIQQAQKFFMETNDATDARNMGYEFAGKAVYSAVWVAAAALFMELLGFSTQKWLTAGGLGTVLLTLAGREIFTNFLSSAMIQATRPFVVNDWIQTKIEGYEVSGIVEHVGWWSPTIVRGEDREAVHIPNHKFTVNVVRNLSQRTHWRFKTTLAIRLLDIAKINYIVADMRKVLAKNPQIEQKKPHRRVFVDNVNPDNQALLIRVSCFVITSHYEEYLGVKQAILLDLVRVITYHEAQFATPVFTIHKTYVDTDLENTAFRSDRGAAAPHRPRLQLKAAFKVNGEDEAKGQSHSTHSNADQDRQTAGQPASDRESDAKVKGIPVSEKDTLEVSKSGTRAESKVVETSDSVPRGNSGSAGPSVSDSKLPETSEREREGADLSSSDTKGSGKTSNISLKPSLENRQARGKVESPVLLENNDEKSDGPPGSGQPKQPPAAQPPKPRPTLEENIVLGVALEGSKRTLPIDEEVAPAPTPTPTPAPAPGEAKGTGRPNGNRTPKTEKDVKDA
ncbi:hypothetical protein Dimus_017733 [Dionaea muscipula]